MPINYVVSQAANVTTLTTVYNPTTSGVQAVMSGCLVANKTGSQITATVTLTNAAATVTTTLAPNVQIPAGYSLDVMNAAKINVPQNYTVKVSATGAVDVTISASEAS
jgi:hypothetical protein